MNASNDNHDPVTIDELQDRLIDRALGEIVGGEAPPDLSGRILSTDLVAKIPQRQQVAVANGRRRYPWLTLAVAATLLIGVPTLLLSINRSSREVARSANNGKLDRIKENALHAQVRDAELPSRQNMRVMLSDGSSAAKHEPTANPDFDSLITSTPATDSANESAPNGEQFQPNMSLVISQTQSVYEEGVDGAAVASSNIAPESSEQPFPAFTSDLDVPYRQNSFELGISVEGRNTTLGDINQQVAAKSRIANGDLRRPRQKDTDEGTGPGLSGDQYTRIFENPFIKAQAGAAVSTFSIDVDTASYSNVRQFLLEMNQLPPPDAVRIEELINYFDYVYDGPNAEDEDPFAAHVEVAGCPWAPEHRLVRIGIKGRELDRDKRPKSNLVFLVDVSGSMDEPNKLPLVVYGLQQLTRELGENDRVAIVVYASSEGLVLPSTPGSNQAAIQDALGKLEAGGSTAGGAGIQLAYQIAEDNFLEGGTNRVVLCTDGDFNVGVTSTAELERLCEQKAKDTGVFLSVLGFGRGNLNDAMMEAISNRGNGNYQYVDNRTEARRVLVEEMTGTLITIAKDVKIQVEFNPRQVAGYRLIGYENRMLRTEDFNDDKKDAGEIGAGHTVTALYEIVPAGQKVDLPPVDDLKYQKSANSTGSSEEVDEDGAVPMEKELLTLKMRYKQPEGDKSKKLEWPFSDNGQAFTAASDDFKFAASVAGFGLMLRDSQYKGNLTCAAVLELAQGAIGEDEHGYRDEFLDIVRQAKALRSE